MTKKTKKDNKKHYINNREFYEHFLVWKENDYKGDVPPEIIMSFYKLSNSMAYNRNFINYSNLWRDEMTSEAFILCIDKARMFNPDKSKNPFSYFTSIIRNSFIMFIKNSKKNEVCNRSFIFDMIDHKSSLEDHSEINYI